MRNKDPADEHAKAHARNIIILLINPQYMKKLFFKIVLITGLFYVPAAYAESYMELAKLSLNLKNSTIEEVFK
ncbi:MAG: hypothetical protein LBU37_13160, partial [Tannerellaceae bacterium]|nr:hypothetical protein [Tannerellaceae bacterium]